MLTENVEFENRWYERGSIGAEGVWRIMDQKGCS
jgi:hypothetical protein